MGDVANSRNKLKNIAPKGLRKYRFPLKVLGINKQLMLEFLQMNNATKFS